MIKRSVSSTVMFSGSIVNRWKIGSSRPVSANSSKGVCEPCDSGDVEGWECPIFWSKIDGLWSGGLDILKDFLFEKELEGVVLQDMGLNPEESCVLGQGLLGGAELFALGRLSGLEKFLGHRDRVEVPDGVGKGWVVSVGDEYDFDLGRDKVFGPEDSGGLDIFRKLRETFVVHHFRHWNLKEF